MRSWSQRNGRLVALLRQARSGDQAAFRDLYRVLYPDVVRFVARRVTNRADAEDIVAAVFYRVLERLELFEPARGSVRAWVLTIARNLIIDFVRRRRDHKSFDDQVQDAPCDPVVQLDHDEMARRLAKLLERYAPEVQEMFALRYGDGLRVREIADVLGLSEAAVKQRFARTLRELRSRLHVSPSEIDYAT